MRIKVQVSRIQKSGMICNQSDICITLFPSNYLLQTNQMDTHCIPFPLINHEDDQRSIFKSILTQIQMQITSPDLKTDYIPLQTQSIDLYNPYTLEKQNQCPVPNKSTSEWVWMDEVEDSFQDLSPKEQLPLEFAQLKRVQSLRMEQENKLDLFIRSNNLINHQDYFEPQQDIKETMNLSPRKKKRIDKEKERQSPIKQLNLRKTSRLFDKEE